MPDLIHQRDGSMHARKALDDLLDHVMEACNFHDDHSRRALSALTVTTLSSVADFINNLRGVDSHVTQWKVNMITLHVEPHLRHPHLLLAENDISLDRYSDYELCDHIAHSKQQRRDAEEYLLAIVSVQLGINPTFLRAMTEAQKMQAERTALKTRIVIFNQQRSLLDSGVRPISLRSDPSSPAWQSDIISGSPQSVPVVVSRFGAANLAQVVNDFEARMNQLAFPPGIFESPDSYIDTERTLPQTSAAPYGMRSPVESRLIQDPYHNMTMQAVPLHAPGSFSERVLPMTANGDYSTYSPNMYQGGHTIPEHVGLASGSSQPLLQLRLPHIPTMTSPEYGQSTVYGNRGMRHTISPGQANPEFSTRQRHELGSLLVAAQYGDFMGTLPPRSLSAGRYD